MKLCQKVAIFVLTLSFQVACADDWQTLSQAAKAGQKLSLQGQYVHRHQYRLSAFSLYRQQQDFGLIERRVAEDGIPREIIKTGGELSFFTNQEKGLMLSLADTTSLFPAVLPVDVNVLKDSYTVVSGKITRIARRNCQWLWLKPKENNRYTQGFCLDSENRLPLAQIYQSNGKIIEINQFTRLSFTQPSKEDVQPDKRLTVTDRFTLPPQPAWYRQSNTSDWRYLKKLPKGFFVLSHKDMKVDPRADKGRHYIVSDGLVNISLFIEHFPNTPQLKKTMPMSGALSSAEKIQGNYKIIAIGDLPETGIKTFVQDVEIK